MLGQPLRLDLFDKDRIRSTDDPLGFAEVQIGALVETEGPQEVEVALSTQGTLRLRVEVRCGGALR